jgi:geranylgeranyl diphosphate synthase type I
VEPKPFAGYRSILVEELRRVLAGKGPLRSILRYHVGLEDASGAPAEALGKLIRPSLTLLIADEFGGDPQAAVTAAVGLEMVHEFSLIHDDIQDRDEVRRGRPTVWRQWGDSQAINAGDLMLVLALAEAGRAGDAVRGRVLDATVEMIEGQALDVSFGNRRPTRKKYLETIDRKTGALFRCACELGAIVAGASPKVRERLNTIGRELGRAFQIRDDLRDDLLEALRKDAVFGRPSEGDLRRWWKSYLAVAATTRGDSDTLRILEKIGSNEDLNRLLARVSKTPRDPKVREEGRAEVNRRLENVLVAFQRLPFSDRGIGEIRALCESLRLEDKEGER